MLRSSEMDTWYLQGTHKSVYALEGVSWNCKDIWMLIMLTR